jgi:hypothetical protein
MTRQARERQVVIVSRLKLACPMPPATRNAAVASHPKVITKRLPHSMLTKHEYSSLCVCFVLFYYSLFEEEPIRPSVALKKL